MTPTETAPTVVPETVVETSPIIPTNEQTVEVNETPTNEPIKPEEISEALGKLTAEQLGAVESGEEGAVRQALGLGEVAAPRRISLGGVPDADRRAMADAIDGLRSGKYASLQAAIAAELGLPSADAKATPPAQAEIEHVPAVPDVSDDITRINAEIAELETKQQAFKDEYDYEEADKIGAEILTRTKSLVKLEAKAEAMQEAQQSAWAQAEESSRSRSISAYPDLANPDSDFSQDVEDEIILAEAKKDNILQQPDWPEQIAKRVAQKRNGRGENIATPQPNTQPTIPPAPRQGIRLPGSPVGGGSQTTAFSPAQAADALGDLTPEQQLSLLAAIERRTGYAGS